MITTLTEVPLSDIERKFIEKNYPKMPAHAVVWEMEKITKIPRSKNLVWHYAVNNNIRKTDSSGRTLLKNKMKYPAVKHVPLRGMEISLKHFDLMQAMSHIDCSAVILCRKIKEFTGYTVTTEQAIEMQTIYGLPKKYATKKVLDFLYDRKPSS